MQLDISADVRLAMVEGLGFYRVATGGRSDNPAHLDVIAGVRYFGTSGRLEDDVLQTGELKLNWVDALVGARFRVPLGSRVALLERLIEHIRGHAGVWFATHADIARYVKEASRLSTP